MLKVVWKENGSAQFPVQILKVIEINILLQKEFQVKFLIIMILRKGKENVALAHFFFSISKDNQLETFCK